MSANPFAERLEERIHRFGPLCVGLDPTPGLLAACGLPDSTEGIFSFATLILDAAGGQVAIVKPQSAYFERHGSAGWKALERVVEYARNQGLLVLLDAKRGDIDTTAEAYAQAFFSPQSACRVDAVTVHSYLGFAALRRFLDYAVANDGGVFVVVRSSNPEGEKLQTARMAGGRSVATDLAQEITAYNEAHLHAGMGPVGAVIGATCADADPVVAMMPGAYLLAPGVGTQGAAITDLPKLMPHARGRVLPSISRGIMAKGTSHELIAEAIAELRTQAQQLWR